MIFSWKKKLILNHRLFSLNYIASTTNFTFFYLPCLSKLLGCFWFSVYVLSEFGYVFSSYKNGPISGFACWIWVYVLFLFVIFCFGGWYSFFFVPLGRGLVKKFCFLCTYHDFALTLDDSFSFLCCFAFFCLLCILMTDFTDSRDLVAFVFFFFLRVLKYIYRKSSDLQTYYKYFHYIFTQLAPLLYFFFAVTWVCTNCCCLFCWLIGCCCFSSANF